VSNPVSNNPNASLAAGTTGVGVLVIYLAGLLGFTPSAEGAAALGGAATSIVLFIGRTGIRGMLSVIWRGQASQTP
jgi:hypothetical protein